MQSLVEQQRNISLCEVLDRVLNKGVVVYGEVILSVADIDLVYLSLQLVLSSVETAKQASRSLQEGSPSRRSYDARRPAHESGI